MSQPPSASEVIALLEKHNCQKVKLAVTDMDGVLRGKSVHVDKFRSIVKSGFGFCNVVLGWDCADVCYENSDFTGWHSGYPDALVKIDLSTMRNIPWDQGIPFFLGDFYDADGVNALSICPRNILKKVLGKFRDLGFEAKVGCEYEWFNFRESPESLNEKGHQQPKPISPGMFGYSLLRSDLSSEYFNDLQDLLGAFNVPIEGLHTETGPGVYEAAISCSEALEAADRACLFKTGVKQIAMRHGITASFMARWSPDLPGSSGHIHQSLLDSNGRNVFFAADDSLEMSQVFKHYLAGLILGSRELLPMMAPTINSYKRLVKGFWAPTSATWGLDNRTCAFRVIKGGENASRLEVRIPGADMNPYLSLSACLAAGLYGIEHKLELSQEMVKGNGYECDISSPFPTNLRDAAMIFSESKIAEAMFGKEFVRHYSQTRLWEWEQYEKAVTDWELKRYFEII
ncbi:MAG: glutamine synthetase family protein [Oligoflexales bacterium]